MRPPRAALVAEVAACVPRPSGPDCVRVGVDGVDGAGKSFTDEVLLDPVETAPPGSVVVVDGLFLQRAELEGAFEFVVWLDVPFEVTARRMSERDVTSPDPGAPSVVRYVEAQRTYFRERAPWASADLVIDNTDVAAPVLVAGVLT